MSLVLNCIAYMVLFYEACLAFLTIVTMINFSQIMKYELLDFLIQLEGVCKLISFGVLAFAVITHHKAMTRMWLLLAYCQINWTGVIKVLVSIYEYLLSEKYQNRAEFLQEFGQTHAPLVGQVLTQFGVILMIYRFYQSLDVPKVIRGPITAMPKGEKSK